jgi:hypothetical protein
MRILARAARPAPGAVTRLDPDRLLHDDQNPRSHAMLIGAVVGAVVSPFLVGFIGLFACRVVVWLTGDEEFMGYMWLVMPVCILAVPGGLVAGALLADRLTRARVDGSAAATGRGFPVARGPDARRGGD